MTGTRAYSLSWADRECLTCHLSPDACHQDRRCITKILEWTRYIEHRDMRRAVKATELYQNN